jgi:hypothetical protein
MAFASASLSLRDAKRVAPVQAADDTSVPVDARSRGLARDFMRRADTEFRAVQPQWSAAIEPLLTRLVRYPLRRPRQEQLDTVIRRWEALPAKFRLAFLYSGENRSGGAVDMRLASTEFRDMAWAEDAPGEPALVIDGCTLMIPSRIRLNQLPQIDTLTLGVVGLHALSRRMQRLPSSTDDASVMADLRALVDRILEHNNRSPVDRINVACARGEWRGTLQRVRDGGNGIAVVRDAYSDAAETRAVPCIRTFLGADDLCVQERQVVEQQEARRERALKIAL